jgi:hypothetical protein
LTCKNSDLLVKIGAFGILAVSVLWGWKIIKMFISKAKKLLGIETRKRKRA